MTTHTVIMDDFSFTPTDIAISIGDSIIWQNNGAVSHTASRDDLPAFDTGLIAPGGQSTPIHFPNPSTALAYFCRPHRRHMNGTITIS